MLEFTIFQQRHKYLVNDADQNTVYTLKKKWRGGWAIIDRNGYELYVLSEPTAERHPVYQLMLNGKPCGQYRCRSKFLEPAMELTFRDKVMLFRTDDGIHYTILVGGKACGTVTNIPLQRGDEYQFELKIEASEFEDFLPLLPMASLECIAPKSLPKENVVQSSKIAADAASNQNTKEQPKKDAHDKPSAIRQLKA
ncbi:MAG: hypothetical protein ACI4J3_05905 [Oscillospiraceae bacterium]